MPDGMQLLDHDDVRAGDLARIARPFFVGGCEVNNLEQRHSRRFQWSLQ